MNELQERYGTRDIRVGLWGHTAVPLQFLDHDIEYHAIREHVGLMDYSHEAKLKVSGRESKRFLQNMLTRDIEYLDPGHSKMTLLLNQEGAVIGDGTLYCLEDDMYLLEAWGEQRLSLKAWLTDYITGLDATLEDITPDLAILAVEGPDAWKLVERIVDFDIMGLRYQAFSNMRRSGHDVIVARTGYTAEYGYKFCLPTRQAPEMWHTLAQVGSEFDCQPCGLETLELCMLEVRFPHIEKDILPGRTPLEASLNWLIDFRKEDFVGRKALLERRVRGINELLVCFMTEVEVPVEAGSQVRIESDAVGTIVRAGLSLSLKRKIGLAYLDYDFAVPGLDLEIETPAGARYPMRTASAPFIAPKSWTVTGGPR